MVTLGSRRGVYIFYSAPIDLVHCGVDHIFAAKELFLKSPSYYDSAGYLAHIGVELLLKALLLETSDSYEGTHNLSRLYDTLVSEDHVEELDPPMLGTLKLLNDYEELRYPNINAPTEVGGDDWSGIEALAETIWNSMPRSIAWELEKLNDPSEHTHVKKSGRVLMRKPREERT